MDRNFCEHAWLFVDVSACYLCCFITVKGNRNGEIE